MITVLAGLLTFPAVAALAAACGWASARRTRRGSK